MAILDLTYLTDPTSGQMLFDVNGYPQFGTNSGANTYANLQARVQNEVLGSPQTSDIQNAITDAIGMFERDRFYFNNFRLFGAVSGSLSDLQTIAGKEFYGPSDLPILTNLPHISKILVLAFRNRYPLNERTPQWIDDLSVSTSWQGLPTDFAWQGGQLRLYPVPDGQYPLILDAAIRFAPPLFTTDYSPWSNRAERLIRQTAKMLLFRDIIRDEQQAAICEREVFGDAMRPTYRGEFERLKAETNARSGGPGRTRPSRGYF